MSNFLSRKFIFTMAALVCGLALTLTDKITGDQFLVFAGTLGGLYQAANVISKAVSK